MNKTLLEIGCDGGSIQLQSTNIHGSFFYKVTCSEFFAEVNNNRGTYLTIQEALETLKSDYPKWHQMYLVQIHPQVTELLKADYLALQEKNEYTKERWLQHLTGYGIGF